MGFFPFLSFSSPPRALQHDVSFDLTAVYPPRKTPMLCSPALTSRPSRVPHIPLEIVLCILEAAYHDDGLETNHKLVRDCSLVSTAWSEPAQRLLFRNVTLRKHDSYLAFCSAVDRATTRGQILGDAVVRMRVVLDHNQPFGISQHSFAHATTLCSNLYELNIALYGCGAPGEDIIGSPDVSRMQRPAPSFDDTTLSLLKTGPRITALQFSNWSDNTQTIHQLLDVWPSLKSLVISGTPPQLPSPSTAPFPCALEEFRMNFQTPPALEFLDWLLHNSANSLQILELEREPSSDLLHYLIEAHGDSLQSLSLPACGSHGHALAVQRCRHLRELKIEDPWASPMVYKKLPKVLQHIALGLDRDTALQPVLDIVKSRPSLRAVTLHIWDGGEHHPQLPALKMACAYRGVELRITHDVRNFRSMIRGDPVPSTFFPRIKCLENLQFMRSAGSCRST